MTFAANHLSHKLEFNLNKPLAKISDRTSWGFLLPGIVFGALLFLLGLYEMQHGFRYTNPSVAEIVPAEAVSKFEPFINPIFFDIIFMLIGLGMIVAGIASYLRYFKFIYDGKTMTIIRRTPLGKKYALKEKLKNYLGVRYRIVFYQHGLMTCNKYIIELYHKDTDKIVPLYISTSSSGIRSKWKEYARLLKLPAVINTDEGLMVRDIANLDKSVKDMANMGLVIDNFDSYEDLPESLKYVRRKDKIVIKRKNVWDIYNIIAWITLIAFGCIVSVVAINAETFKQNFASAFYGLIFVSTVIMIGALLILFRKEKLVLKKHKIVHTHKYMLFSTKHDEIMKEDIESVEVTENPASGRFFVSLISENKTIAFGAKLPISDLQWIKKFLIHEIIK